MYKGIIDQPLRQEHTLTREIDDKAQNQIPYDVKAANFLPTL